MMSLPFGRVTVAKAFDFISLSWRGCASSRPGSVSASWYLFRDDVLREHAHTMLSFLALHAREAPRNGNPAALDARLDGGETASPVRCNADRIHDEPSSGTPLDNRQYVSAHEPRHRTHADGSSSNYPFDGFQRLGERRSCPLLCHARDAAAQRALPRKDESR